MAEEETRSSERIYAGRVVSLRVDTVQLADGRLTRREIVEHGAAVAIVALDASGTVLLVRQYRKPVESHLLEIPAGGVEPGEDPAEAARRELQEETGFVPRKLEHLVSFYTTPGFSTELMHLYLATELEPDRLPSDDDESIQVVRLPLTDVVRFIAHGEIADAKTLVGLLMVVHRLSRPTDRGEGVR